MSVDSEVVSQAVSKADRRPKVAVSIPGFGMLWLGAWLFTIGFAQLGFWKAVLALAIWPYFLGVLAR